MLGTTVDGWAPEVNKKTVSCSGIYILGGGKSLNK